jgi:hypothetical protein
MFMGNKYSQGSIGILSGENKSAGFTSLLVLAGLSVAAGSMLYSSTVRTRNMNTMLQTDRVRYNRDAIANALRYSVSIPSILRLSADLDPSSDLKGCIDSSNATPCDAVNADGTPKVHDLKVYDIQSHPLAGTSTNPVFYDALNGNYCSGPSANCPIQAIAWFTINCGSDTNCKGKPAATLNIGFKVEQGPGDLPNKMALSPMQAVPYFLIPLTLSALQTNVTDTGVAPGDPNSPYTPIDDTANSGDISVFDPITGSKVCNDMKARNNPPYPPMNIVYDSQPTLNSPAVQYSNIAGDLHAADENISTIDHITGNVWANAKTITSVSVVSASGAGLSLNAADIGSVSNIASSHSYIVAHNLGPVSNITGHLYASADKVTQFSNIASGYFNAVYRGWASSGTTAPTPASFSNITAGNFLLCGFNVNDLSNVAANFVGLQDANVLTASTNVAVGQLTVFHGNIANLSNFTGNITLYNGTAGNMTVNSGNLAFYNSTAGQITLNSGHVEIHGGGVSKVTGNVSVTIDLYGGATLGSHPGIPASNVTVNP